MSPVCTDKIAALQDLKNAELYVNAHRQPLEVYQQIASCTEIMYVLPESGRPQAAWK